MDWCLGRVPAPTQLVMIDGHKKVKNHPEMFTGSFHSSPPQLKGSIVSLLLF